MPRSRFDYSRTDRLTGLCGDSLRLGLCYDLPLRTPAQCARLVEMFDDDARFRNTVIMARHAYGEGSYR